LFSLDEHFAGCALTRATMMCLQEHSQQVAYFLQLFFSFPFSSDCPGNWRNSKRSREDVVELQMTPILFIRMTSPVI
jgi:hypothetical protein